jgi:hypothetical protein
MIRGCPFVLHATINAPPVADLQVLAQYVQEIDLLCLAVLVLLELLIKV